MLLLRRLINNSPNEDYVFFCLRFLKCIVGVSTFNAGWNAHKRLSELATPSDEALALLILENSEARWSQEFDLEPSAAVEAKTLLPKAKYTSSGRNGSMKGFTKKFSGWSAKGIERFNELLKLVKEDRIANGEWFDFILEERRREQNGDDEEFDAGDFIKADNDLFDDMVLSNNDDFCLGQGLDDRNNTGKDEQEESDEDEEAAMASKMHAI